MSKPGRLSCQAQFTVGITSFKLWLREHWNLGSGFGQHP